MKGELFMSREIDGVKCVVNTCMYHTKGDRCTAKAIEIRPRNATRSNETDCSTFRVGD